MANTYKTPLTDVLEKGTFGANTKDKITFSETVYNSVVQVVAYKTTEKDLAKEIKSIFKVDLPAVGTFTAIDGGYIQWVGAHRYQIVSNKSGLTNELENKIDINIASVVDLSDARAIFNVKGSKVIELLSKGASIDFNNNFNKGDIVLTNMSHIGVMVNYLNKDEVELYVYRTFAKSFYHFLTVSAEEWGYQV
ncbi:MAG: sarcosine oxidase subunit gamma [Alphaproteobacteria bacterium]